MKHEDLQRTERQRTERQESRGGSRVTGAGNQASSGCGGRRCLRGGFEERGPGVADARAHVRRCLRRDDERSEGDWRCCARGLLQEANRVAVFVRRFAGRYSECVMLARGQGFVVVFDARGVVVVLDLTVLVAQVMGAAHQMQRWPERRKEHPYDREPREPRRARQPRRPKAIRRLGHGRKVWSAGAHEGTMLARFAFCKSVAKAVAADGRSNRAPHCCDSRSLG